MFQLKSDLKVFGRRSSRPLTQMNIQNIRKLFKEDNILAKCDTANKSHNGVVKFRRYYLGKSRLFYIHLRGFPPHPIYVSGHKTNADKCENKMNIRFISTLSESNSILVVRGASMA